MASCATIITPFVPHDKAYSWAKWRLYTVNSVTRCLEVRDLTALEQITPLFAQEAAAAPQLLFATSSDTVLRRLGVDDVAHCTVRQLRGNPGGALGDKDERTRWQRLLSRLDLPWNETFLSQEYRHVLLAQDLRSEEEYLACERRGRGSALGRAQRRRVWQAVTLFEEELARTRSHTWLQVCAEAARLLRDKPGAGPSYDHVFLPG
ncbi:hypothetical protein [Streptomyces prasinus]